MAGFMIDTHSHYVHKRFDCGRNEILTSLSDENIVAVIEAAIDYESNEKMKALCKKYSFVYMAAGCHPNCVEEMDDEKFVKIIEQLEYHKVVAIGETGLDYAHEKTQEHKDLQKIWFRKFVELAMEREKPLVIHCREAYDELIEILSEYTLPSVPGVIHCFSGTKKQAEALIGMGFYLGIGGMFTRQEEKAELVFAIKNTPVEKMVLETDAPFLIPKGAVGNRNTSLNLKYIVEELALLKECEKDDILETIFNNVRKVFPQLF